MSEKRPHPAPAYSCATLPSTTHTREIVRTPAFLKSRQPNWHYFSPLEQCVKEPTIVLCYGSFRSLETVRHGIHNGGGVPQNSRVSDPSGHWVQGTRHTSRRWHRDRFDHRDFRCGLLSAVVGSSCVFHLFSPILKKWVFFALLQQFPFGHERRGHANIFFKCVFIVFFSPIRLGLPLRILTFPMIFTVLVF